jgi:hypothetical protein
VNNIERKDQKPVFGEQCMAFLPWYPRKAVNYHGKTEQRARYHHPDICAQDLAKK